MASGTKTYLVTGGAGFIGANFVKYLLKKGNAKIVVLDALTYAGNLATLQDEINNNEIIFVRGDITDRRLLQNVFEQYDSDYIVNFAAETHVDRSIDSPSVFVQTNVTGTHTLLEVAKTQWLDANGWMQGKRFLQVSTDEVYGSLKRDYSVPVRLEMDETLMALTNQRDDVVTFGTELFTEDTPLSPRSPYSASKASADMLVSAYGHTYGMPVLITRCSNNYGPYQFPEKLIPLVINNVRQGRELPVYGKGLNVRDWLYVEDHVRAIDAVLEAGKIGEVYNIGGLNEQENISIVRLIIEAYAEITSTPARYDLITYVSDRPGHDMRYAIDASKIAKHLGWAPKVNFKEGIKQTVRWYVDNTDWMETVISGDYRNYYSKMYDNR